MEKIPAFPPKREWPDQKRNKGGNGVDLDGDWCVQKRLKRYRQVLLAACRLQGTH